MTIIQTKGSTVDLSGEFGPDSAGLLREIPTVMVEASQTRGIIFTGKSYTI